MKIHKLVITLIFILGFGCSALSAQTKNIVRPKLSLREASAKVLDFCNEGGKKDQRPYIYSANFGQCGNGLRNSFHNTDDHSKINKWFADQYSGYTFKPRPLPLDQWGWLFTVIQGNDLSNYSVYFASQDGEVTHITSVKSLPLKFDSTSK